LYRFFFIVIKNCKKSARTFENQSNKIAFSKFFKFDAIAILYKILWFFYSWGTKRTAKTENLQEITDNAHFRSYSRIIIYTWNHAWRFYLRQDFLIMPSLVRSTPVLARAWKLTALLSTRRIARLYLADLYQLRKSSSSLSLSLVVKPHAVKRGTSPNHMRIGTIFSELCHNTSLRAVRRFIASHKVANGMLHVSVFNIREPHSVAGRR